MRGFLEEGNTLLMVIFAVVIIVLASVMVFFANFSNIFKGTSQVAEEFNILGVKSHPFSLAELISHKRSEDRNLFEQLLQTSTAGLDKAGTSQLPLILYSIAGQYNFIRFFEFTLVKNNTIIFTTSNIPLRCGQNDEGFCVYDPGYANVCDTGRVVILDMEGKCEKGTLCCKYDLAGYVQKQGRN